MSSFNLHFPQDFGRIFCFVRDYLFRDMRQTLARAGLQVLVATIDIVVVHGDAGDLPSLNAVQGVLGRKVNLTSLTLIFSFEPTLRVLPTHISDDGDGM
jgi:hypothetical protein